MRLGLSSRVAVRVTAAINRKEAHQRTLGASPAIFTPSSAESRLESSPMAWPLRVRATVADQRPLCSRSRAWLGDLVAGGLHCCDELLLHLAQLVRRVWAADQVFTKMSGKGRDGSEVVACDSSLAPSLHQLFIRP